jgi:hypothetical protein
LEESGKLSKSKNPKDFKLFKPNNVAITIPTDERITDFRNRNSGEHIKEKAGALDVIKSNFFLIDDLFIIDSKKAGS